MSRKPIRITAYMRTGVVSSDNYLPLDAILFSQMLYQEFGAEDVSLPGGGPAHGKLGKYLPLDHVALHDQWFYKCSFAQWEAPYIDDHSFWVKRFNLEYSDLIDFGGKSGRVDTSAGTYKGYQTPLFLRHTTMIRWYAVGDADRVRALLSDATHIGKKAAQGWGRVNCWEVEPWAHDWSMWHGKRLMRAIPTNRADGVLYSIRPPYHNPANQTLCRLPTM